MQHREPDAPIEYRERPYITSSPRVVAAIGKRLRNEWLDTTEFDELELYHIDLEVRRQQKIRLYNPATAKVESVQDPWFESYLYTSLWNQYRPQLLAPVDTSKTGDFVEAWGQPEAVALFDEWWDAEIRPRDRPSYEEAKAVVLVAGGMGRNLIEAHDDLHEKARLSSHFTDLAMKTTRAQALPIVPPLLPGHYSPMTRLLPRICRTFPLLAMKANIAIVKELARLRPELNIGRFGALDGMLVPYWCPQVSAKERGLLNEEKERHYNRGYERIGFVAIGYGPDGQFSDRDKDAARRKKIKACRGGRFVLLVEVVTGLPLVGMMLPANQYEVDALYELLKMLFGLWGGDCPLEGIVGDKLYDVRDAHEFCERRYGVHMIAIRKPSWIEKTYRAIENQDSPLHYIDGRGIAYCREHGHQFEIENVEIPNRTTLKRPDGTLGLLPGDEAPEGAFRYRYRDFKHDQNDKEWCGRPTLRMATDWSQLAYYPHNGVGGPRARKRYHERCVLEAIGRNQSESAFASLQTRYGLGTKGSKRPRVRDDYVYESLIWAALLTRSLKMLADQRNYLAGQNGSLLKAA